MGHSKRETKESGETHPKENANVRVNQNSTDMHQSTALPDGRPVVSRHRDCGSSNIGQFAKDLHVFCAARKYYTPDVRRRFMELDDNIRQGASNDQVLVQIENIVDAIARASAPKHESRLKKFWLRLK